MNNADILVSSTYTDNEDSTQHVKTWEAPFCHGQVNIKFQPLPTLELKALQIRFKAFNLSIDPESIDGAQQDPHYTNSSFYGYALGDRIKSGRIITLCQRTLNKAEPDFVNVKLMPIMYKT